MIHIYILKLDFHNQRNVLEREIQVVMCVNNSFTFIAIFHDMDVPVCLVIHRLREILLFSVLDYYKQS